VVIEIKKRLLREVIKPFFKENGYRNKGVNFEKDISPLFTIVADIQSQRYYKTPEEENFRINCQIISPAFNDFSGELPIQRSFGSLTISQDNSWITISDDKSYEDIAEWLRAGLDKIIRLENRFQNTEAIIQELKEEYGIQYAYLLQYECRSTDLSKWIKHKKEEIVKLYKEISNIETEANSLSLKPDSLDKQLRTDGLSMKRTRINDTIKRIQKEIDLVTII